MLRFFTPALLILTIAASAADTKTCEVTYTPALHREIVVPALKRELGEQFADVNLDDPLLSQNGREAHVRFGSRHPPRRLLDKGFDMAMVTLDSCTLRVLKVETFSAKY